MRTKKKEWSVTRNNLSAHNATAAAAPLNISVHRLSVRRTISAINHAQSYFAGTCGVKSATRSHRIQQLELYHRQHTSRWQLLGVAVVALNYLMGRDLEHFLSTMNIKLRAFLRCSTKHRCQCACGFAVVFPRGCNNIVNGHPPPTSRVLES